MSSSPSSSNSNELPERLIGLGDGDGVSRTLKSNSDLGFLGRVVCE
jgi:hypothetical protein